MNQSQSSLTTPAHDDAHSIEAVKKHVRQYLIIGVALMLGTGLTVWASLIDFGSREINIVVALVIAAAKGFLVVGFFMHLLSEKKMIYSVLATTVFFFAALLYLTLWSMARYNAIHIH
jgi:cytochrome c oxidase subunit IV